MILIVIKKVHNIIKSNRKKTLVVENIKNILYYLKNVGKR